MALIDEEIPEDNQTIQSDQRISPQKSPKRRRDADQRILDQFWIICDPNPNKRNKSLKSIIQILIKQNETNGSNDLTYCLERLVRGMASARQFARHGFCVLLTQLLTVFKSKIPLDLVFNLSEKHLGKVSELPNHDSVIGWSLIMGSIIKSQRLVSEESKDIFQKSFDVLYTLGMNKQYIELVVCQLFEQFLDLMANKKSLFEKITLNQLKEELKTDNKFKPFFIFICLSILERIPKFSESNSLKFMVKSEPIQRLSVVIKESTGYQPSVHPFNEKLIKYFIKNDEKRFSNFWISCVDHTLFTPNQIEKGFLGFELIKISLKYITTVEEISTVFTSSFLRLFIQSLSVKTHPLHSAAQQLCQFFVDHLKTVDDSELQLEIVNNFTKEPGSLLFDDISKSKFFSNLIRNLNSTSIEKWTQKLKTIFLNTEKVDSNDILRNRCIQQISNLSKSLMSDEENNILWTDIKFLFFHSYFDLNDNCQPIEEMLRTPVVPINDRLRNTLKDGFRNAFNYSLHSESKSSKEKLSHEVETLLSMVEFINHLVSNQDVVCLADPKFLELFKTIAKKVNRLKKKLKSQTNPSETIKIQIFISLYSMVAIQLLDGFEEIDSILPDLNECMTRALNENSEANVDSSPVWADVLTDLLLSMMTSASKLTKNILISCFKHICSHLTNEGIQRLVDAIIPSNDNKLFDGNDDSEEEDEEEENEDSESESESESDEDEEENPNSEIDEKFRNDVINALGPAAQNDDDEESVYLSDSEMFQFDESLATVFKTKFADKKEILEKRNSIIAFRLRCLELIEIFLTHKYVDFDKLFLFIEPIVAVAKTQTQASKQNQLSNKAIQLMAQINKIKDLSDNSLEVNDLQRVLSNLLSVIGKSTHLELQKALVLLIKWIISLSKKLFPNEDWYMSDIETALKAYFEKNNCQIPEQLFKSLISAHTEIGLKLYDLLFEYSFKEEVRPFKKWTTVEILISLFSLQKTNPKTFTAEQLTDIREKCLRVLCTELTAEKLQHFQYLSGLLKLFYSCDCYLKEQNSQQKMSDNDYQELSSKLRALSKQKKKKLDAKPIITKIISTVN